MIVLNRDILRRLLLWHLAVGALVGVFVLQPINDIDVVIDQLPSLPPAPGVDVKRLTGLAKASMDGGEVNVDLDVSADAKAQIEAMLTTIKGIGIGIKELPKRSAALSTIRFASIMARS